MSNPLNRFEKAIGVRKRPTLRSGDIVLLSRHAKPATVQTYGKRSTWIVCRRARGRFNRKQRDSTDGYLWLWIRNMRTDEQIMIQRRELWWVGKSTVRRDYHKPPC